MGTPIREKGQETEVGGGGDKAQPILFSFK